jgi:hypothetical protein
MKRENAMSVEVAGFKRKYVHRLKSSTGEFIYMYRRGDHRIRIGRSTDSADLLDQGYRKAEASYCDLQLRSLGMPARNPVHRMLRGSLSRAKKFGREHTITVSDVWAIMEGQGFRCALTGLRFNTGALTPGEVRPFGPSIDRLDNTKGYTRENIRIVCNIANIARNVFTDEDFYRMCYAAKRLRRNKPSASFGCDGPTQLVVAAARS